MNLQSYYYNCSPDYIDSIDPSLQVHITSVAYSADSGH